MNKDINNIDLANKMADILNFSFKCFFEEIAITYDSNITIFYRYKSSTFEKHLWRFSQNVKNSIYKICKSGFKKFYFFKMFRIDAK